METVVAAAALGVAGLDPAGALILVAALAAGARRRGAAAFTVAVFVTTVVLGVALSVVGGPAVAEIDWSFLELTDGIWVALDVVVALALGVWAVRRLRRRDQSPTKTTRTRATTAAALAGAGALFALTAVPDPSWLALIVLAGRTESVGVVVLAHVLWIVISQLPLLLIFGAVLTGRHDRAVAAFQRTWARFRPRIFDAITTLIAAAAAFFAVDAGWYLLTGGLLVD